MKNIFVMGLNDFNRALLEHIRGAEEYAFHGLIANEKVEEPPEYRIREILAEAEARLAAFPGSVDAIVGYIDIPVGALVPLLCQRHGLPSPTLERVLRCQHKYWARSIQQQAVPEHIPSYCLVDPFAPDPEAMLTLDYPFWLKPVKSAGSFLGFRIANRQQFHQKLEVIRENIDRLAEPFNFLVEHVGLEGPRFELDFSHCIAESLLTGRQCTLEGYVHDGDVVIYGVVDSIRAPNRTSFLRYEYPSRLPRRVQQRMIVLARRVMSAMELTQSPFNMECYWNEARDHISVLEINTRISQSHNDLFHLVDGASNHQVMVEIGLGRRPTLPHRAGPYRCAAKFFIRSFEDGIVTAIPTRQDIARLERTFPGARVKLNVAPGTRLWDLVEQDSYSYDLGWVFLGADNAAGLHDAFRRAAAMLPFRIAAVSTAAGLSAARQ